MRSLNLSRSPSLVQLVASTLALVALTLPVGLGGFASDASAEEDLAAKRAHWQSKYRTMRRNKAILEDNIAKLEHNYAQAQRRNYPRGGAREAFRTKANEQREQLAKIEEQLESIFDEARRAEVPPGWLYEVEDEPVDLSEPASPDAAASDDEEEDDGRNPIYRDRDEDEDF